MFHTDDRIGLGSLYAPAALVVHGRGNGQPLLPLHCPFWLRPVSTFGLFDVTTL